MEKDRLVKTPNAVLIRMQIVHFGKIVFNLQFIVVAIMVASVLTFILPALYYLILLFVAAITLFSLFVDPTFRSLWTGGETLTKVATYLTGSWKYTVPLVAVLSIVSILCLCFDRNKKHMARIIFSVFLCLLALIILFLKLVNSGGFQ